MRPHATCRRLGRRWQLMTVTRTGRGGGHAGLPHTEAHVPDRPEGRHVAADQGIDPSSSAEGARHAPVGAQSAPRLRSLLADRNTVQVAFMLRGFSWYVHGSLESPSRSALRRGGSLLWKAALVLGVGLGGLWTATHGVAGVAWSDVGRALSRVTPWHLLMLTGIWFAGLGIYSSVLAAALPGLGARRGLLLNLSGSAVANVVPLGGAVATALNWRMVRIWGHSNSAFATYCVLTNALDVVTKLVLPLVGVAALVALSGHVPTVLWVVAGSCAAALLCLAVASPLLRRLGNRTWARISALLAVQWRRLLPASAGYVAAQVVLLYVSLRSVGLVAPVTIVLMAAAIERLGTLVPLTPGGTGVAELGTIAWLAAAGLDPVQVVAGVLLYRAFLIALEVPVGGILLAVWVWLRRTSMQRPRAGVAT